MSFQQGLSGLSAASRNLEVIGNNVANAGTAGFKQSRAQFADIYANAVGSGAISPVGIGTTMVKAAQQFTQGNLTTTSNPLDMAINGNGFFRVSQNGTIGYTRNGQFELDKNGYITTMSGGRLSGYPADAKGIIAAGSPTDLKISSADLVPKATTAAKLGMNLDSRLAKPAGAYDPTKPATFQASTTMSAYDSLGNQHSVALNFVKSAANTWDVYTQVDGDTKPGAKLGTLTFKSDGTLDPTSTLPALALTPAGADAMSIAFDVTTMTQFGSASTVTGIEQDGYASGKLAGFSVGADGKIQGQYSNGKTLVLGQVALASFGNPQGLTPMGGNLWAETSNSGTAQMGVPGTGNVGALQGGTLEESNVDLTAELVNMITAQREYQANAQTIKTEDQLLQTLVNLR